jgi:hypothetical protein
MKTMITLIKQWIIGITGLISGGLLVLTFANVGITQAQSPSCELVNNQQQMNVFFAPLYAESQIKDILPKDTPYTMIGRTESFFRIEYNEGEIGWIDLHTRILNGTCLEIDNEPPLDIALSDFPTVCFYTITEELIGYSDRQLTQQHGGHGIRKPGAYAVVSISNTAVELMGSSAMSGGYIEANHGTYWGHCSGTLQLATALDNTRVWTQPDAVAGEVITTLDIGTQVGVLGDAVIGNIQADVQGDWFQITKGTTLGWVWVDRLKVGRTFTTQQSPISTAKATENARLWTQPDVNTGQIITILMAGSDIKIIGNATSGVIQLDSQLEGLWYPAQQGGTTGWLYEGRLSFGS